MSYLPPLHCQHGAPIGTCAGSNSTAPCRPRECVFCPHGFDTTRLTADGEFRCPTCRGITAGQRNGQLHRPRRRDPAAPMT